MTATTLGLGLRAILAIFSELFVIAVSTAVAAPPIYEHGTSGELSVSNILDHSASMIALLDRSMLERIVWDRPYDLGGPVPRFVSTVQYSGWNG